MTSPLVHNLSASSDYFDNDPDYLRALREMDLPGDEPPQPETDSQTPPNETPSASQTSRKRPRSDEDDDADESGAFHHRIITSVDQNPSGSAYLASDTYGKAHFGGWGEYMARKRAKLQIQNTEIDEADGEDGNEKVMVKSRIFEGLQIYVRALLATNGSVN